MSELVHIINPDLPGTKSSIQVKTAYEKVWKKRGWQIVSAKEAIAHDEAIGTAPVPTTEVVPAKAKTEGGER